MEKINRINIDSFDISKISFRFPLALNCGRIIFRSYGIGKSFGDNLVFKNVYFDIYKGDKIAFVGKNGCGKTTLTKIINGSLKFDGEAKLGEKVVINYFAQNQNELLDINNSIIDYLQNKAPNKNQSELRSLLGAFLFSGDDIFKKIKVLSGGEKARLALCSFLLIPSNVLILDEPTNHLDEFIKDILKHALMEYDGTVILVSQDRAFLSGLADRVIEFDKGKVSEYPGDIDVYLNYNNQISYNNISKFKKGNKKKSEKKLYLKRKNLDKKIRLLYKQNKKIESEISLIEGEIDIQKNILENNNKKYIDYKQYNLLNNQLNLAMSNWEKIQMKISEMEKNRNQLV